MAQETGVSLQADQLSTVPGGPVRFIQMSMPINGVPTLVQAQVVAITDDKGTVLDWPKGDPVQLAMLIELRQLRRLFAAFMGVAVMEPLISGDDSPTIFMGGVSS